MGSIFAKARYMIWVVFKILARAHVPQVPSPLPRVPPPLHPEVALYLQRIMICRDCDVISTIESNAVFIITGIQFHMSACVITEAALHQDSIEQKYSEPCPVFRVDNFCVSPPHDCLNS